MSLFVDGPVPTIDDLTDQDSGLLEAAQTCGINATTKLRLAHDEIEADLELWLLRHHPAPELVWKAALRVEQVVVTATLREWETMQALALFYRDAYFSQLADRYQAKWDEYTSLTRVAYEKFVATGMGLVNDPVHKAALPLLGSAAGPQQGGTFYAGVAWVNAAGQEGAASAASSIPIADGELMTVSAAGTPSNVVGFNVYAGATLSATIRQNNVLLPPGATYTYVPGAISHGPAPGSGQRPDFVLPLARTLLRG